MNPSKLKNFRWKILPKSDSKIVSKLAQEIQAPYLIAQLLINRGITNYEEARKYFAPNILDLHNPFLMKSMEEAVVKIIEVKSKNLNCMVFGDYDVDGTNGCAMLYLFLKEIGINVTYYIPNRFTEGYGVSKKGIDEAKERNVNLLITVDCGVTNSDILDYASSLGIETIICDHHEPSKNIPNVVAVLDTFQEDCSYPFKYLSGCGVAFKLIQALILKLKLDIKLENYIDFVAIATAADLVSMTQENKTLTTIGLKHLQTKPRVGYKSLLETGKLKRENFSTESVVFGIAPRINAAGRLKSATTVIELLTSNDELKAKELSLQLETSNTERKSLQENCVEEAIKIYENSPSLKNGNVIVLYKEDWHQGVVGIVASKLVDEYFLPTIVLTNVDGKAKGSCRSINGVSIYQALHENKDLLIQFGGHSAAAGLTLEVDKIDEFREALSQYFKKTITQDQRIPTQLIDAEIPIDEITPNFTKYIYKFTPHGPDNLAPVFVSRKVNFKEVRLLKEKHFKAKILSNGKILDCIAFDRLDMFDLAMKEKYFDILFTIEQNFYNGRTTDQLKIKEIRIPENLN